jgi:dTDP-4-dehydrorhamnose 3,5-epimerase
MKVLETDLPGVLIVEPDVHRDPRGYFVEIWKDGCLPGWPIRFVQDNMSFSTRGVLRGLHYQHPSAQGKLVSVLHGCIFDVAVDIRRNSPTFGRWFGLQLDSESARQLYVPEGFAHGFAVQSDQALVLYKCTSLYAPGQEGSVAWDDPDLAIQWPIHDPVLSDKDRQAPRLKDIPSDRLPLYH